MFPGTEGPRGSACSGTKFFSEVVHVPSEVRQTPGAQAAARVHGVPDDEIDCGTSFPESWVRFLYFAEACLNNAIDEGNDGSDDEPSEPRAPDVSPNLLLVGHNSCRFDFAVLLFECERHTVSMSPFQGGYLSIPYTC